MPETTSQFYRGAIIAQALGMSAKTVQRRAQAEGWPARRCGNRLEYVPPVEIAAACAGLAAARGDAQVATPAPELGFTQVACAQQRQKALLRERAVLHLWSLQEAVGRESALSIASLEIQREAAEQGINLSCTATTLRRWEQDYRHHGLNGLVEQKQGRVGAKPIEVPPEIAAMAKAYAIEFGSGGRSNVARAKREVAVASHPSITPRLREALCDETKPKSYMPRSLRKAFTPAQATVDLARGPRHARLKGAFTPCSYDNLRPGDVFVADDMTANILCWSEWPGTPHGYRIGQAQVLAVQDVASLRWLSFRVVWREGDQYTSDDIWGLFGDVFDTFGLPHKGFVLERGHWESKKIKGHKPLFEDGERIGGLQQLGLEIFTSYDPRSKIIENQFDPVQRIADRFPGFAGRDQRHDQPERIKKLLAECKSGKRHPREVFPHISQLADHYRDTLQELNRETREGKILRGEAPMDKWARDAAELRTLPAEDKWLYRTALNIVQVTCNGIRITKGTGWKKQTLYWDNPELLVSRQGQKVAVYWDDYNPQADAIICTADRQRPKFIGIARRVQELDRFAAEPEQLAGEAARKRARMNFARCEMRAIDPHLVRNKRMDPYQGAADDQVGRQIRASRRRQEEDREAAAKLQKRIRGAGLTEADVAAATRWTPEPGPHQDDQDEDALALEISSTFGGRQSGHNSNPAVAGRAAHGNPLDSPVP